jgi:hypothetical protein
MGLLSFARNNPGTSLGLALSIPVGGVTAMKAFRDDRRNPDMNDRASHAAATGVRGMGMAVGVGALAGGLWMSRNALGTAAGKVSGYYGEGFAQADRYRRAGVPAFRAYSGNPRVMMGGGILAGGAVGAAFGHPIMGAAIGAGVGLSTHVGLGISKLPGMAKAGGILALSTLVFAGVKTAAGTEVQSEAYAAPDNMGGYEVSSVKDRMNSMGATGDMVFGLNYGRH